MTQRYKLGDLVIPRGGKDSEPWKIVKVVSDAGYPTYYELLNILTGKTTFVHNSDVRPIMAKSDLINNKIRQLDERFKKRMAKKRYDAQKRYMTPPPIDLSVQQRVNYNYGGYSSGTPNTSATFTWSTTSTF